MLKRRAAWPQRVGWLVGGIAAVVVALAIAWVLFVPGADWLAHNDVASARGPLLQTARDAARGRLLTLGAGLLAAGALLFTARNFALSREGQVTDRYTKAIEQLGSDKLDVRIGGIYALERVARDSARDHPTVMEVLAAFIREHSHEQWSAPQPATRPTRPDVQAAVTVIGRRIFRNDRDRINLTQADLTGADLTRADLTRADLARADLTDAKLRDSDLTRTVLTDVVLTGATLIRATLTGADLTGAVLTGADLTDAVLTGATLTGATLTGAVLTDAVLTGATLTDADLTGAVLTGAVLTGANLDGADLAAADLTGAVLTDATLTGANLIRAGLTDADLTDVHLDGANLDGANLTHAVLTGATLTRATLHGTNLRGTDLTDADLTGADLTGARWPRDAAVPEGWKLDTSSGRLERAGPDSGSTEAN